jgi:hypothetical protein
MMDLCKIVDSKIEIIILNDIKYYIGNLSKKSVKSLNPLLDRGIRAGLKIYSNFKSST